MGTPADDGPGGRIRGNVLCRGPAAGEASPESGAHGRRGNRSTCPDLASAPPVYRPKESPHATRRERLFGGLLDHSFPDSGTIHRCHLEFSRSYHQKTHEGHQITHGLPQSAAPGGEAKCRSPQAQRPGESEHDPRIEINSLDTAPQSPRTTSGIRQGCWRNRARPLQRSSSSRPAPALEAHRSMPDLSPSASGTGYASTFARAGFKTVAR
jgi:hypothetical protein